MIRVVRKELPEELKAELEDREKKRKTGAPGGAWENFTGKKYLQELFHCKYRAPLRQLLRKDEPEKYRKLLELLPKCRPLLEKWALEPEDCAEFHETELEAAFP